MTTERYDAVVLGLGGMGSAALYHLARQGMSVCGLERHGVAHEHGGSHGDTRVISKALLETPDCASLLDRAYTLWNALQEESGVTLLTTSGAFFAGDPDSELVEGLEHAFPEDRRPYLPMPLAEARRRYPDLSLPDHYSVFMDPAGGCLAVERCIEQHIRLAEAHGATVCIHEEAVAWQADHDKVLVQTERRAIEASVLIITAGPWTMDACDDVGLPLQTVRKVQLWYDFPGMETRFAEDLPVFCIATDYGEFCGFPPVGESGMKVLARRGGQTVEDPDALNRGLEAEDEEGVLRFLTDVFPALQARRTKFSVGMFTVTPDRRFVLDRHPRYANVLVGAGFADYGFQFAPAIGETLADLALERPPRQELELFQLKRFSLVS